MVPYSSSSVIPVSKEAPRPWLHLKRQHLQPFQSWNLHFCCKARSIDMHAVWSGCRSFTTRVYILSFKSIWYLWVFGDMDYAGWAVWSNFMFFFLFFFLHFETSTHLHQLLRTVLQKTSPNLSLAWVEWIINYRCTIQTVPLNYQPDNWPFTSVIIGR